MDSTDRDRIGEARDELQQMLANDLLSQCVVLILANKQDLPSAMSTSEITDKLSLHRGLKQRTWFIQPCSAINAEGLFESLDWISSQLAGL